MMKAIDWNVSLKLANNRVELAKELLTILMAELPITQKEINSAWEQKDYTRLHHHIHKLHGATCYCGVPRLKEIVTDIENQLQKKHYSELENSIKKLDAEIKAILKNF